MKYIVITSKHHDGFCLWDSKVTNYDIMDAAPYKKDLLQALADACKKEGIAFCFYHSIMDWHHPDAQAPFYPDYNTPDTANANFGNYAQNYMIPQIEELVIKYDPEVMWFDGEWIPEWTEPQGKALYNIIRNLKPSMIINNRVGKGRKGMQGMNKDNSYAGDFGTPEQEILEGTSDVDWEACMTMNDTWGFKKNDDNWKSAEMLIHNMIDIASKGGNYLLNVGPTAEGLIPAPSVERLQEMGQWMEVNGEGIYASSTIKNYKEGEEIRYTQSKTDPNTIYAFALNTSNKKLTLKNVKPKEGSTIMLLGHDTPVEWKDLGEDGFEIQIPEGMSGLSKYALTFRMNADVVEM